MSDYNHPADEEFFGAVGRLTISWSHLELGLDGLIVYFYHVFDNPSGDSEPPYALKRKIKFLRKTFSKIITDDAVKKRWLDLLSDISTESNIRHDLIHGAIIGHESGSGVASFARLHRKHGDSEWKTKTMTTKTILQAAVRMNKLANPLIQMILAIQEIVDSQLE